MPGNIWSKAPAIAANATTPRGWGGLGGVDKARWLGGAPALEGKGRIPNITPGGLQMVGRRDRRLSRDGLYAGL